VGFIHKDLQIGGKRSRSLSSSERTVLGEWARIEFRGGGGEKSARSEKEEMKRE